MPDAYLACPVVPSDLQANIIEVPPGVLGIERMLLVVFAIHGGLVQYQNVRLGNEGPHEARTRTIHDKLVILMVSTHF